MKQLLFLCTGNYYRSRFAHALFNHLADRHGLTWRADSAGLAIERLVGFPGYVSRDTIARLHSMGIDPEIDRPPIACHDELLRAADRIIALHELEHRPLMLQRHPDFVGRVEFWSVPDLDAATPEQALGEIERRVIRLAESLRESESLGEPRDPQINR